MAADPRLCVVTPDAPCPAIDPPFKLTDRPRECGGEMRHTCIRCDGCNGDGRRTVHTPLDREYARQVLAQAFKPIVRIVAGDEHWHAADVALDALGVDR